HGFIYGVVEWRPMVDPFLKKLQLPIALPVLRKPAGASADMSAHFERYIATPNYEKAFAIGEKGRFGWVSRRKTEAEAINDALKTCGPMCRPYAINDTLSK